jgi:hypothetical protein
MESQNFTLNVPFNSTSLGQVSTAIARELYKKSVDVNIFPISSVDLSSQREDKDFLSWLERNTKNSLSKHSRKNPVFKLWHLNGSLESFSERQVLLSFYEVDRPTDSELNIVKNNSKVLFSSKYAISRFEELGCSNLDFIPLGFDSYNFYKTNKRQTNAIQFGLFGKLEPQRKRHLKTLSVWAKKYGNNPKYALNCAIFNNFLDPNLQSQIISQALEGKQYWNINFLPYIPENTVFNDLLNNIDIVLAMSGGEGWGLPEFQSVALGKHCVGLNAHAYKEWMTESNSVLINPTSKIPVYDNFFFKEGTPFNQGEIFDWNEEDLIVGMERAVKKFEKNPENLEGIKLQEEFSYSKIVDNLLNIIKTL